MTVSIVVVVGLVLTGFTPTSDLLLAQTPADAIDTVDGKTYVGRILDETARGYLIQPEGGAPVLIEYSMVRAVRRGGSRAQPEPARATTPPPTPPPEPIGAPESMPPRDRYAPSAEDYAEHINLAEVWGKRDVMRMSRPVLINELNYLRDNRPGIGVGVLNFILGGAALVPAITLIAVGASVSSGGAALLIPGLACLAVALICLPIAIVNVSVKGSQRSRMSDRIEEIQQRLNYIDPNWQYRSEGASHDGPSPVQREHLLLATF